MRVKKIPFADGNIPGKALNLCSGAELKRVVKAIWSLCCSKSEAIWRKES